jgi:hypothetical protein
MNGAGTELAQVSQQSEKTKTKGTVMNDHFDELAKALARPVARRAAVKRFGFGLGAFALAALGLTTKAHAGARGIGEKCSANNQCQNGLWCVRGVCSTNGGPGSQCSTHADCGKGLVCRYSGGLHLLECGYR